MWAMTCGVKFSTVVLEIPQAPRLYVMATPPSVSGKKTKPGAAAHCVLVSGASDAPKSTVLRVIC